MSNAKRAKDECQVKYDSSNLQLPQMADGFCQKIETLHQLPYSCERIVNGECEECKGALIQRADEVLGKTKLKLNKNWFNDECQLVTIEKKKHVNYCIRNVLLRLQ
jgi:hypothetical protein